MVVKLAGMILALFIVGFAGATLTPIVNRGAGRYHSRTNIEKAMYK